MPSEPLSTHFSDVSNMFDEFRDSMSDELHYVLLALRDSQHAIDLVSGSQLPSLPHYRMNLVERVKLNK